MANRSSGSVKWFNNARGYGFITCEETQEDIFVHFRNIAGEGFKSLHEGQTVEFDLTKSDKGYEAENVEKIEMAEMA